METTPIVGFLVVVVVVVVPFVVVVKLSPFTSQSTFWGQSQTFKSGLKSSNAGHWNFTFSVPAQTKNELQSSGSGEAVPGSHPENRDKNVQQYFVT